MSKSRAPLIFGSLLAAGTGYYLYSAGGKPKLAEKQFESDLKAARDRATASGEKFDAEKFGAQAGAKVDEAWNKTSSELNKKAAEARDAANNAAKSAEAYAKDAQARINQGVDAFDKKVEETASKTKSGVSSWFGGK